MIIIDFFKYDIKNFFWNLWKFRKELYKFRTWDSSFNIMMFRRSLELTYNTIKKYGIEEEISRSKKVIAMKRAIELMKCIEENNYIEQAENILNHEIIFTIKEGNLFHSETSEKNKEVYELSFKIEKDQWIELWDILKGKEYIVDIKSDDWEEEYDGSNLKRWWD